MGQKQTTVAERNYFIDLKLNGHSLAEIADKTGWSFECVRHWWRRYRAAERSGLDPQDGRKQRGGVMSSFSGLIRFALLRLKKEHPGWGAAVTRPRVAERLKVDEEGLPSLSTIEKYWAQFKGRLYPRHQKRAAQQKAKGPCPREVHQRWQADFKEKMKIADLGQIEVFNIRDEFSPVKIGSFVYPSCEGDDRRIQAALRQAFSRWGLCDRFQIDKDRRLVNSGEFPFPSRFTLWLAGLGISHELAGSAQENGCAERFHRTWYNRVVLGRQFKDYEQLQQVSDEELDWLNRKLPSRGRACQGRPPLAVYPEAENPRWPYQPDQELDLFSLQRVYRYLAQQHWWRHVSQVGQISLGGYQYGLGTDYAHQDVKLIFLPNAIDFVVMNSQGSEIKRLKPKGVTVSELTGLEPP